jgi:hypothetical protein
MKFTYHIIIILIFASLLTSCTEETTPQANSVAPMMQKNEAYYANLRAYKKSNHQIFFAWIGGMGVATDPNKVSIYDRIPDSLDIVSIWGSPGNKNSLSDLKLREFQKMKGTKFVISQNSDADFLNRWSGEANFAKTYDTSTDKLNEGFEIVAKRIRDTIVVRKWNGIDLDHEPNYCGCDWGILKDGNKWNMFLTVLSKYLGPLSGTDLYLMVNGEYNEITEETAKGITYITAQAYNCSGPNDLNNRRDDLPPNFPVSKFIVTENFESYWSTGGVNYKDPKLGTIPSLLGMAYWQPKDGIKAGAGAFHAEYEYNLSPDFKFTRNAIQIMNPAKR